MPTIRVKVADRWFTVEVADPHASPARAIVDGEEVEVQLENVVVAEVQPESIAPPPPAPVSPAPEPTPAVGAGRAPTKLFSSPMPGVILSVAVSVGDEVVTGDEICVLEAMKMQQMLRADWSGIVRSVHVEAGQQVLDGDPIVELE
jgi:propionyl-CoA carboxylase alpha chain